MKNTPIISKLTGTFNKLGYQIKKYSPEICVAFGVVGVVASTVMACKATTKVSEILDETKENLDVIHKGMEDGNINGKEYTKEDGKKDLAATYVQTGIAFVKLYGPSVVLGGLSLTSIVASNRILRRRCGALAAAYATVDRSFKEYRGRVSERFGKDVEQEIRYGIKHKEIEETVVNEDGTETTVKKTVSTIDPELAVNCSPYAKFFDEASPYWEKDAEYNLMFLQAEQNYANDLLKSQGYLFLNDVYKRLGLDTTKAGQVVGWIYDKNGPIDDHDNYVDFGIFTNDRERTRAFVNGHERSILLDFNVDGNIWDRNSWATY